MTFCADHWTALRTAVADSELSGFVADSGEQAAGNLVRELTDGPSVDSFDPLMTAFFAIQGGASTIIAERYGQNPMMIFADESDPAVTWPTCPICALNWCHAEHDRICEMEGCNFPPGYTYDDEAVEQGLVAARAVFAEIST